MINNSFHIVVLVIINEPFSLFIINECLHVHFWIKKKYVLVRLKISTKTAALEMNELSKC